MNQLVAPTTSTTITMVSSSTASSSQLLNGEQLNDSSQQHQQRLVTSSTGNNDCSEMGKRRKAISRKACENCRKAHACCSDMRPCKRCSSNNLPCFDIPSKKRGRKRKFIQEAEGSFDSNIATAAASTPTFHQHFVVPPNSLQQQQQPPLHPPQKQMRIEYNQKVENRVSPSSHSVGSTLLQFHQYRPQTNSLQPPAAAVFNNQSTSQSLPSVRHSEVNSNMHYPSDYTRHVNSLSTPQHYGVPTTYTTPVRLDPKQLEIDIPRNEMEVKFYLLQTLLLSSKVKSTTQRIGDSGGFLLFKLLHDKSYQVNFWERFDRLCSRAPSSSSTFETSFIKQDILTQYQIYIRDQAQKYKSQSCKCGRESQARDDSSKMYSPNPHHNRLLLPPPSSMLSYAVPVEDLPDPQYLRRVLDLCETAVLVYSIADRALLLWNSAVCNLLGYSEEDMSKKLKSWMDILHSQCIPLSEQQLDEQLENIKCCQTSKTFTIRQRLKCELVSGKIIDCSSVTTQFTYKGYAVVELCRLVDSPPDSSPTLATNRDIAYKSIQVAPFSFGSRSFEDMSPPEYGHPGSQFTSYTPFPNPPQIDPSSSNPPQQY